MINYIRNLRIRLKLYILVGVALIGMLIIGGMSFLLMGRLNEKTTDISTSWLPSIDATRNMANKLSNIRLNELGYLTAITDDVADMSLQYLQSEKEEMAELLEKYKSLIDEEEQSFYDNALTLWSQYDKADEELMALAKKGQVKEARAILEGECTELYNSLNSAFNEIISYNTKGSEEETASSVSLYKTAVFIMAAIIIAIIIIGVFFSFVIIRLIKLPVSEIEMAATKMAEGDFTVDSICPEAYTGGFHPLLVSFRSIADRLNDTLSQISQSSSQVANGSEQVSSGAQSLSQGATEQASSVEQLAATISEISDKVKQNAESAGQANNMADTVSAEMNTSNQKMQHMIDAMSDISNCSNEISKIIKTIEDIAFQTNILSLNAAVEAARAGAAGKGFAVVADEVRNLASKSAEASKNTAALIENSLKAVENGTHIADETAKSLVQAVDKVSEMTVIISQISEASSNQADSISQITTGIDQISSVVQINSATAQESAAASQELSGQSQLMKDLIGKFKLKEYQAGM